MERFKLLSIFLETIKFSKKNLPNYFYYYILICVLYAFINFFSIDAMRNVIDSITLNLNNNEFYSLFLILIILKILCDFFSDYIRYLSNDYFMNFMRMILKEMNTKASKIKFEDFEVLKTYNMVTQAIRGVNSAITSTILLLNNTLYYLLFFMSVTIYFFSINPLLSLILPLLFIPKIISQFVKGNKLYDLNERNLQEKKEIDYYKECLCSLKYVKDTKALNLRNMFIGKLKESYNGYYNQDWVERKRLFKIDIFLSLITFISYMCAVYLIIYCFFQNMISIGIFSALYYSLFKLLTCMESMVSVFGEIIENIGLSSNLYKFLNMPEIDKPKRVIDGFKTIKFENVSYTYPYSEKPAIKNLSLEIKKGEKIAIVGRNGSGKSTFSKLLLGLLIPTEGSVKYDSSVLGERDEKNKCASAVFQNFIKYKLSFLENIVISDLDKDIKNSELDRLNQKLKLNDLMEKNNCNFDTVLSKEFNGIDLSIGEWQKIAIARGLHRDFSLIIYDEPTASIDPIKEKEIYSILKKIDSNTSVYITHRMASIKDVNRIIVLEKGEVIEEGNHLELMNKKGLYYELFSSQAEWYL